MICDYLRSCYSTSAVLTEGAEPVPIIWYWADEAAKLLPHKSAVTSLNWMDASERGIGTIGEVAGSPRPWRNGSMPGRPPGQDFHGEPSWYVDGSPPGETLARTPSGIPVGCGPDFVGQGGAQVGGSAQLLRLSPPVECPCCPDGQLTEELVFEVSEATGIAADLPGRMVFTWTGPHVPSEDKWIAQAEPPNPPPAGAIAAYGINFRCSKLNAPPTIGTSGFEGQIIERIGEECFADFTPVTVASCVPRRIEVTLVFIDTDNQTEEVGRCKLTLI